MTKDGITTFTTRPGLEIDPKLRLSTYWVIAALLCLGIVLPFVEEIIDASSKWLSFAQMAMLCYALAVVIWGLERWWPSLARWFVVIVLSILVNLAFIRLGIPDLYPVLILLPLLALALLTWPWPRSGKDTSMPLPLQKGDCTNRQMVAAPGVGLTWTILPGNPQLWLSVRSLRQTERFLPVVKRANS